jgi:ABC-type phosphate transport system permease subunit
MSDKRQKNEEKREKRKSLRARKEYRFACLCNFYSFHSLFFTVHIHVKMVEDAWKAFKRCKTTSSGWMKLNDEKKSKTKDLPKKNVPLLSSYKSLQLCKLLYASHTLYFLSRQKSLTF